MKRVRLFALLLVLPFTGGVAQTLMYEIDGGPGFPSAGTTVAVAGDLDGDGFEDIASAGPLLVPGQSLGPVGVVVRTWSGATGTLIHEYVTSVISTPQLHLSLTRVGDLNGDGLPELALGMADLSPAAIQPGLLQLLDGASGALIFPIVGSTPGDSFGYAVAPVGDLTGDGVIDMVISAPALGPSTTVQPLLRVFSGSSGTPFLTLGGSFVLVSELGRDLLFLGDTVPSVAGPELLVAAGPWQSIKRYSLGSGSSEGVIIPCAQAGFVTPQTGWNFADLGDQDGDGTPEFVVGRVIGSGGMPAAHLVFLSGWSGICLQELTLPLQPGSHPDLVGVPDVDGDGARDLALTNPAVGMALEIRSGATGAPVLSIPLAGGTGPAVACGISDLNGDGVGDLLVGLPQSGRLQLWSAADAAGAVVVLGSGFVWSGGIAPVLSATPPVLGQVLTFDVTGGAPLAQGLFVLSPASGTPFPITPGFVIYADLTAMESWTILPIDLGIAGTGSFSAFLPLDLRLSGLEAVTQVFFPSPPGFSGASITNGLRLTVGF